MYLETPKKFRALENQAHQVAAQFFRPISRKYDKAEHAYPKELDLLAALLDGMNEGSPNAVGATSASKRGAAREVEEGIKNGGNLSALLGVMELCWGDVGLLLAMPRQGLGNAAIAAVANDEQLGRFGKTWAAMAITEPGCGSDSAAIRTTAVKDGDHYILNGEKIFVTSGERAKAVVVWATLDKGLGRAAIFLYDGHEGGLGTGQGDYAVERFAKVFYDALDHPVLNGTSNSEPYYWHINTYCNWGEPWYGGFRESMQEYRIQNQALFDRNYVPNMLGWYRLTATTSVAENAPRDSNHATVSCAENLENGPSNARPPRG